MVNTNNIVIERNKELLAKIEELENKGKTEISREAQLKIIDKIEKWKKENIEVGDRLKKYQGNTYPSHITDNTTDEWPLWRQLAGHVNGELNLVQYLDKKEEPLNELLEMMLNSITRKTVGYYNLEGLREKERKEYEEKINKYKGKITRLIKETFPYDKLEEKPLKWNERIGGVERGYLDTINGTDHSDFIISFYKEREEDLKEKENFIKELEEKIKIEEVNADTHFKAIKACEEWYTKHPGCLKEKLEESVELLEKSRNTVENQRVKIENLEKESRENLELLEKARETIEKQRIEKEEEQNRKSYLGTSLPKERNKFKKAGAKLKTDFQQLVKKVKSQTQEFIARIEVRTK